MKRIVAMVTVLCILLASMGVYHAEATWEKVAFEAEVTNFNRYMGLTTNGKTYVDATVDNMPALIDVETGKIVVKASDYCKASDNDIYILPAYENGHENFVITAYDVNYEQKTIIVCNATVINEFGGSYRLNKRLWYLYTYDDTTDTFTMNIYDVRTNSVKSDEYTDVSRFSQLGGYGKLKSDGRWYWIDENGNRTEKYVDSDDDVYVDMYAGETISDTKIYSYGSKANAVVLNETGEEIIFEGMEIVILGDRSEYILAKENGKVFKVVLTEKTENGIKVLVNGKKVTFDQEPMITEGRTLVPVRAIFEALGAEVGWDDATKTVTAQKSGVLVKLTIGSNELDVNGEVKVIDVPAQIVNSRTMVPARAVAEAFGCKVSWEENTRAVIITE